MSNWYVLHVLSHKTRRIMTALNKNKDIEAFIPQYEFYLRSIKDFAVKPMFPGYIFIKTTIGSMDFSYLLKELKQEEKGIIRELSKENLSALRDEEIKMFEKLLDCNYIARMSQAVLVNKKAKVYQGPLMHFEDNINKVDMHNKLAYLDLSFLDRRIQCGLIITGRK